MPASAAIGHHLLAGRSLSDADDWFSATDPQTGEPFETRFPEATLDLVDAAATAAAEAAPALAGAGAGRADLLRSVADRLDAQTDEVVGTSDRETGLGQGRLTGELGRTTTQLRLFATMLEEGSYVDAVIDHADPDATPPRPDLRRMLIPIGPVAVFGASNFPLAFSVAGGDTASALAAGCPVIVKGHPAHPRTSQLVAQTIAAAVKELDLPPGVFSLLHSRTPEIAGALVEHPALRAVGFTGSAVAGRALFDRAASRPDPIPVFAEMGSLNPLIVTAGAATARAERVAEGFVGSMTMGVGQFCTKPGLLFAPSDRAGDRLVDETTRRLAAFEPGVLLTPGIREACADRTAQTAARPGVTELARAHADGPGVRADAVLLGTEVDTLLNDPALLEEHFGPTAIIVRYDNLEELQTAIARCPGSLAGGVFAEPAELSGLAPLLATLRERVGRILFDGFPTGVAVTHAMQHGGPYPATTDPRFTSVGTPAVERWLRPVAYQNAPAEMLPAALAEHNPLGIWRLVDGAWTRD